MNFAMNLGSASPWLAAVAAFGISLAFVGLVRQHATKHAILDVPSERSSHTVPTPRGGGIGLVLAQLIVLAATIGTDGIANRLWLALAGVVVVMLVGWFDDRFHLSVQVRLAVHLAAALSLIPLARAVDPGVGDWTLPWLLGWVLLGVVAINLVNFMDGIDGLVAAQGAVLATILALSSDGLPRLFSATLALACLGFLYWNWSPARIFLGDAGSGALGLLLVLALLLASEMRPDRLVPLALPFLPLVGDSSITLVRRILRRERITSPHRKHLYQRIANGGAGHAAVAAGYATVTTVGGLVSLAWGRLGDWKLPAALVYVGLTVVLAFWLDRRYPVETAGGPS